MPTVDLAEIEEFFTVIREPGGVATVIREPGDRVFIGTTTSPGFTDLAEIEERFTNIREETRFSALRESAGTVTIGTIGGRGPAGDIGMTGPAGADGLNGLTGPTGPTGPPGPSGVAYRHVQGTPSSVWEVTHNLGYKPGGITVIDSGGDAHFGHVEYLDDNTLRISFFVAGQLASFSGEAFIS